MCTILFSSVIFLHFKDDGAESESLTVSQQPGFSGKLGSVHPQSACYEGFFCPLITTITQVNKQDEIWSTKIIIIPVHNWREPEQSPLQVEQ